MAASDDDAEGESAGEEVDNPAISIAQIHAVRVGKAVWYPDTQSVQGCTYFKVSKYDRTLTKLTLGKGVQRHKKKSTVSMATKKFWKDIMHARREACNQAFRKVQQAAIDGSGQPLQEGQKLRDARAGDEFFIRGGAVDLPLGDTTFRCVFQLKGDLWLELTPKAVEYVIRHIKESPDMEPCSPKRRRKRKPSGTPKRENSDKPAEAAEEAAGNQGRGVE